MGGNGVPIPLRDFALDLEKMAAAITPRTKIIFVNNPNNPTGSIISKQGFDTFLDRVPPQVIVILDEAYIEFTRDSDTPRGFDYVGRHDPYVIVLRTFSKAYGLAGLRIGYGAMDPAIADYLNRVRQPFNTGALSQVAALAALDDEEFVCATQQTVWDGLQYLYEEVGKLGLRCIPTHSNFFLIETPWEAKKLYAALLCKGVIVRAMSSYGLDRFIRINAGLPAENERFVLAFASTLDEMRGTFPSR
jgi:histidinol-phosphate aminotransferase